MPRRTDRDSDSNRERERRPGGPAGFSLLEALVTTAIFLIVLYGVYLVYDVGEANYVKSSLERLGREIRTAGYANPKLSDPVVIATNDTLSFHADLDGSGATYVTYSRRDCTGTVTTTLYRNVSTTTFCGGEPFVEGVSALTFTYYELNNVPLPYPLTSTYTLDSQAPVTGTATPTTPAAGGQRNRVRQVKIALTIQQQIGTTIVPFTATTDVALRNLLP
ncbi:MAG: prepilin-type N-terminal cleavage/methylation domain-containing protein [candidate division NC10 bacterium]|nr:prepilin-type N-terminal cleavage/methylation domain-containing protein [candidate division NC10 bacterium]